MKKYLIQFYSILFLFLISQNLEAAQINIVKYGKLEEAFVKHLENPPPLLKKTSKENKIPKIIHQIWIGSPLPEKFKWMVETWKEKHPDWTHILWTDKNVEKFQLTHQSQYDIAPNFGAKSDILRYEILERFGGLYVDIDYECLKPFDQFHTECEFYACAIHQNGVMANALIGCKPHHPIMRRCVKALKFAKVYTQEPDKIMAEVGPWFFTDHVKYYWLARKDPSVRIFKPEFSFPMPSSRRFIYWQGHMPKSELENYKKSSAFALHYWATSWLIKK